jgi:hypothetical protein
MLIRHGKKERPLEVECPCCKGKLVVEHPIFFPREVWHPRRTYDFFRGYECQSCGYLCSEDQIKTILNEPKPRIPLR